MIKTHDELQKKDAVYKLFLGNFDTFWLAETESTIWTTKLDRIL